ncbi:MAG TPA: mannonate dehydratase [Chloroflexota bacterium]|nr:mannonate dehydratase [Chloroflexota bacterium]
MTTATDVTIQEQLRPANLEDETLSFYKAIGVDYVSVVAGPDVMDGADRLDYWRRACQLVESHGMRLMNVASTGWDDISLARPNRDAAIAAWCTLLQNLGAAGIPTLGYNFKPAGNFRTASVPPGRGGAAYSTFDYEALMKAPPHFPEKVATEEQMWERLGYFLERVLPVAEACGVRMALHPNDPPVPEALGGTAPITASLDQFERIFRMAPSPCNVMLFCQGCVAEMGEDIPGAIRRIGAQGKIAYVHFRNIRGTPRKFQEVFLDEGDVDMFRAMQTYREVGFRGPFMMDHTPRFPTEGATAWGGRAFAVGYIRALIQAVYR